MESCKCKLNVRPSEHIQQSCMAICTKSLPTSDCSGALESTTLQVDVSESLIAKCRPGCWRNRWLHQLHKVLCHCFVEGCRHAVYHDSGAKVMLWLLLAASLIMMMTMMMMMFSKVCSDWCVIMMHSVYSAHSHWYVYTVKCCRAGERRSSRAVYS